MRTLCLYQIFQPDKKNDWIFGNYQLFVSRFFHDAFCSHLVHVILILKLFSGEICPVRSVFICYVLLSTYLHLSTGLNDYEHPRVLSDTVVVVLFLEKANEWRRVKKKRWLCISSYLMFRWCLRSAASPLCYTCDRAKLVFYGPRISFCLFFTRVQLAQINRMQLIKK